MEDRLIYEERIKHLEEELFSAKDALSIVESNNKAYRLMLESISDTVIVTDDKGSIKYVCPNTSLIFGLSQDEVYRLTNIENLLNGRVFNLEDLREKSEIKNVEWEITDKSGQNKFVLISVKEVNVPAGSVLYVMRDITERKQEMEELQDTKQKWMSLVENTNDFIMMIDEKGEIQYINRTIPPRTVDQVIGKTLYDFAAIEYHETIKQAVAKVFETREQGGYTSHVKHPSGTQWFETVMVPILEEEKVRSVISFNKNITQQKQTEEALRKRRVDLEKKTKSLEELNTAMKILLEKREKDKTNLEDSIMTNVNELIIPYFDKIKTTKLDDKQKMFLDIIESNMNEIVSPFTRNLSLKYLKLTPTEIKVANMVKHGITTKEIAKTLNISPRTVDAHRKNIRTKIGLKEKRANLRSYLLAMH